MPGQALRLGPFVGGLNRAADPVVIGDEELIDCLNFELDIDGSLTYRPAIRVVEEGATDERLLIFGHVEFSEVNYLFATQDGKTFVSDDLGETWTELAPGSNSRECITMEVYQNNVWLPATPDSANGGISWTVSGGAVAEDAMPRGIACVTHKNRLYIAPGKDATNSSRLNFSEAGDFTDWPGTNFIDVADGDGSSLNNLIVYQDNLLLFKGESTHVLAYDLHPEEAILREINSVVGSHDFHGVVQHENTVYCLHHNNVYEIVNYNFGLLNLKVPFEFDNSMPPNTSARYEDQHLSLFGDRLVVRFFNRTYVFGLRTRTWSEWKKTDDTSTIEWHIFGPLVRVHTSPGTGIDSYFSTYSFDMNDVSGYKIIKMHDEHTVIDSEGFGTHTFKCIATTKDYDMADPIRYKRLFWWGADLISGNTIVAGIKPITLIFSPTWDEGEADWDEDEGTWDNPEPGSFLITDSVAADLIFNTNKLVKFHKGLRFRKVNFSVQLETNGLNTQQTKLFSILAIISTKQVVSERMS
jgi:hypothetical protein